MKNMFFENRYHVLKLYICINHSNINNLRVFVSVSAATNCRYFFISVVWSTTVGLGAGTEAMAAPGTDGALDRRRGRRTSVALISKCSHVPQIILLNFFLFESLCS